MNRVTELFGVFCNGQNDIRNAVETQICPYSGKKCYKTRKSAPEISIGTCTIIHQAERVIICPKRLLENNQIFLDCLHLLTLHEPGNELFILPEISVPGGSVDYFLVSARNGSVKDFAGIELQTMDTTGTVWPERQRLLYQYGIPVSEADRLNKRAFGINWKMTAKTILMQLHHKAETFERLNKHLVLAIQTPFLDYIRRAFSFSHIQGARIGDPVHIHAYRFREDGNGLKLSLDTRVSATSAGIAQSLGLNAPADVDMETLVHTLEQRLSDEYRLTIR